MDVKINEASLQDGTYPRPQLLRRNWASLDGTWSFLHDDRNVGQTDKWWTNWPTKSKKITVPFAPETSDSGVNDKSYHPVIWYRRKISSELISESGLTGSGRLVLHFGAVDYRAKVWVNEQMVGAHEGGHTPFSCDVTDALSDDNSQWITVRVEDDPLDLSQPRGKQDWQEQPHVIWYDRTSGIWQPVWLEAVPDLHITELRWTPDLPGHAVHADVTLSARPDTEVSLDLSVTFQGELVYSASTTTADQRCRLTIPLSNLRNRQDQNLWVWSPEHPNLFDAELKVDGDAIGTYFGVRSCEVDGGRFLLNGLPYYLRSVLSQGFWPTSHLTAPCPAALQREVELIKELGFNSARLHQKFEDPRMLYWADRLGVLVWAEAPACYDYTPDAVERTTQEWLEVTRRDYSHPCIGAWVPLNESWGVHEIRTSKAMQNFAQALVSLTRALDGTRPVVSNDGWEQIDTDIVAIHDYEASGPILEDRYADDKSMATLIENFGPAGRKLILKPGIDDAPVMLTEFGGVSYDPDQVRDSWGYSTALDAEDFQNRVQEIIGAVQKSPILAGFCYTQLTDTQQETNGLLTSERTPKVPLETLRAIISA